MHHVYFALFPDPDRAADAVRALSGDEFGAERVTVIADAARLDSSALDMDATDAHDGLRRGALIGAAAGAAVIGVALPFVPFALVAGDIVLALTMGAAAGGAYGALGAALTGSGVPSAELERWRAELGRGRVIVTAAADDLTSAKHLARLLAAHGALEVKERGTAQAA